MIEVEKVKVKQDRLLNVFSSEEYLNPTYNITIHNAHKNFGYYFAVVVDERGKMHFKKILQLMNPEFVESRERVVKGIIEVYLQNLLEIIQGVRWD
jgi:hypothetical protein